MVAKNDVKLQKKNAKSKGEARLADIKKKVVKRSAPILKLT